MGKRPGQLPPTLTEEDEASILAHDTGDAAAGTLHSTRLPRGPALGVVELPPRQAVLLPTHERAPVGGSQGEHSGPHARPPGRLDLGQSRRLALAVEAGEVNR